MAKNKSTKAPVKKLSIKKETLRRLTIDKKDLAAVAGGLRNTTDTEASSVTQNKQC
jgi:hypothetical protein